MLGEDAALLIGKEFGCSPYEVDYVWPATLRRKAEEYMRRQSEASKKKPPPTYGRP